MYIIHVYTYHTECRSSVEGIVLYVYECSNASKSHTEHLRRAETMEKAEGVKINKRTHLQAVKHRYWHQTVKLNTMKCIIHVAYLHTGTFKNEPKRSGMTGKRLICSSSKVLVMLLVNM